MNRRQIYLFLALILVLGGLFRSYGLFNPWGNKDHYNFGGPFTSSHIFCLKRTPLAISQGRSHTGCDSEQNLSQNPVLLREGISPPSSAESEGNATGAKAQLKFYVNHPSLYHWGLAIWVSILGEAEWAFRSFTLVFSILNIFLVFLLARKIFNEDIWALWAAGFQSFMLGPIYFGTHVDYPNEINVSFILGATIFALSDCKWRAFFFGFVAGCIDWPGFFTLPLLGLYFSKRERSWLSLTLGCGLFGSGVLGWSMYLSQSFDLFHFLADRISGVGYEKQVRAADFVSSVLGFLGKIVGILKTQIRLVSPAFVLVAAVGNFSLSKKLFWPFLLLAGPFFLTTISGLKFVAIHSFWSILIMPTWALLCTLGMKILEGQDLVFTKTQRQTATAVTILVVVLYPYGIYQSDLVFDITISLLIVFSTVLLVWGYKKKVFYGRGVLFLAVVANALQCINYRSESFDEYKFCKARLQRVLAGESLDPMKRTQDSLGYYCRGL